MMKEAFILLSKEVKIEWRQKYALSGLLLYVVGAVLICYMGFFQNMAQLRPMAWNSILWIMLLFVAIQSVSKSFQQESNNRHTYYFYLVSPKSIILSKVVYNLFLMLVVGGLTVLIFHFVMPPVQKMNETGFFVKNTAVFYGNILLGCSVFAASLTLVSGIASKVSNSGALMAVLSFPIVLPLIAILIRNSINAINDLNPSQIQADMLILGIVNILLIAISLVLFPYLWRS